MSAHEKPVRRAALVAAVVLATLAPLACPAAAQTEEFRNALEAYLMGVSMSGTIVVGRLSADVEVPSSKILENLKFGALLNYRGEARKWAVAVDLLYAKLGAEGTTSRGGEAAEVGVDQLIADIAGAYRFSRSFEALAGVRYTYLGTTVTLASADGPREARIAQNIADPFLGIQLFLPLSRTLQLQARGDIGGFGVGCTLTWQAIVRLNWQASRVVRVGLGYRLLDQYLDSGSGSDEFKWNILMRGPLVAAGITF